MISKMNRFKLAFVLALAISASAPLVVSTVFAGIIDPTITTQRSPAVEVVPGQSVMDSSTVADPTFRIFPSFGSVQFYTCHKVTNHPTDYPTFNATTDGTALGSPATMVDCNTYHCTATSLVFNTNLVGTYCFLAVYSGDPTFFNSATASVDTPAKQTAECFSIQGATAVTVSSMSPQLMEDGGNWAIVGLGALSIAMLGAVVFMVARRR